MPRLRQVPRAEAPPDVQQVYDLLFGGRDPVAEPGTATGTPGNWWTVFALVPDVFRHCVAGFGFYRSKARKLDPKLRELGQMRAGFVCESQFVFSQHCKAARDVGLAEEKIAAVPALGDRLRLLAGRARRARLHRRAGAPARPRARRHLRGAEAAPLGRGDPRAHLRHRPLLHARRDDARAAARVRRRARAHRRGARARGRKRGGDFMGGVGRQGN